MVRLQIQIRDQTADATALTPETHHAYSLWFILGWPAFGALVMVFWLMINKPILWG